MEFFRNLSCVRHLQTALLILVMLAAVPLRAAEKVAVFSLAPTDQLLTDAEYLLTASGLQGLGQLFVPQVKTYLQGINSERPIGVVVTVDQMEFSAVGFLPVTNLDAFLQQLKEQVGDPIDAGDGVLELQGPQPLFVKEKAGWAFFGQTKDALNQVPDNPEKLLESLEKQYDIGVRAYIKNVPDPYKQMAIGQIREGLERGLANSDDAGARQMADAQIAQLSQLIQDTDSLTFGWRIDADQRRTYFDLSLRPTTGSEMAKQVEAARDVKTRFGGFLAPEAAIQVNMASVLLPDQIEQAAVSLDRFEQSTLAQIENDGDLDNRTRSAAKQLVATFFKIARSTVKTGTIDSCTSVILNPKSIALISAGHVASGSEVETAVKQLVAMAQNESEFSFSSVKLNADQHAGVRFHTLAVPIPEEEYVRKVLGDTLNVAVGVADTSVYLALGSDGLNHLKTSIDASAGGQQTVEPFRLEIALLPILKFAQSVEPNPMVDAVVQIVGSAEGKDHLRVRTSVNDDGVLYRFELEEGILRILGQAGQMVSIGGF